MFLVEREAWQCQVMFWEGASLFQGRLDDDERGRGGEPGGWHHGVTPERKKTRKNAFWHQKRKMTKALLPALRLIEVCTAFKLNVCKRGCSAETTPHPLPLLKNVNCWHPWEEGGEPCVLHEKQCHSFLPNRSSRLHCLYHSMSASLRYRLAAPVCTLAWQLYAHIALDSLVSGQAICFID